jgi:peptide-methionine (S)-S-oxide reductase
MGQAGSASMVTRETALKGRDKAIVDLSKTVHYVLKTPLIPKGNDKDGWQTEEGKPLRRAVFATGCYWGSEKSFWKMPGVYSTTVGSCGGFTPNPEYEEVCTGQTGHAESVQVFWDPAKLAFADLVRQHLQSHDPTQGFGQGNDRGTQYRSGIYPTSEEDFEVAKAAAKAYEKVLGRKVTTEIVYPPPPYYYAEEYMQGYLAKPGSRPYCSAQPQGIDLPPYQEWLPAGATPPKLSQKYWDKYAPVEGCVIRDTHAQIKWDL